MTPARAASILAILVVFTSTWAGCVVDEPAALPSVGYWTMQATPLGWSYQVLHANGSSERIVAAAPDHASRLLGAPTSEGAFASGEGKAQVVWSDWIPIAYNGSGDALRAYSLLTSGRIIPASVQLPLLPRLLTDEAAMATLPSLWDFESMSRETAAAEAAGVRMFTLRPLPSSFEITFHLDDAPLPERIELRCLDAPPCRVSESSWTLESFTPESQPLGRVQLPSALLPLQSDAAQPVPPLDVGGLALTLPRALEAAASRSRPVASLMEGEWGTLRAAFMGRPLIGEGEWTLELVDWDERRRFDVTIVQQAPSPFAIVDVRIDDERPLEERLHPEGLGEQGVTPLAHVPFLTSSCPDTSGPTQLVRVSYLSDVQRIRTVDGERLAGVLIAVRSGTGACAAYEQISSVATLGKSLVTVGEAVWPTAKT